MCHTQTHKPLEDKQMKTTTMYIVYRNGSTGIRPKTFKRNSNVDMAATWKRFNTYAKEKGFTEPVESGQYLGALAWKCPRTGEIMELRKATEAEVTYINTPAPEVRTTDYQFAHGKMPRGTGSWAFFMNCRYNMDKVWFAPMLTSFAEAKKLAIEEGRRRGATYISVGS